MSVTAAVNCVTAWTGMRHIAMEHVNDAKSMKSTETTNNIKRSVNSRRIVTHQNHHTVTIYTRANE